MVFRDNLRNQEYSRQQTEAQINCHDTKEHKKPYKFH